MGPGADFYDGREDVDGGSVVVVAVEVIGVVFVLAGRLDFVEEFGGFLIVRIGF